ncbi:Oxidoreductase family, NAD-binding Rossmann fold protein [Verrucomicrobia bacterium]|nr:Oxidoreductase family, NAD-binding Rossmann fold protein [Verrucomicrobiota bacterium]
MRAKRITISRRSFLKTCSLTAAASGLPAWFVERQLSAAETSPKPLSANDRPGIALVGCGGMGRGDAGNASRFGDIVALCDVDEQHLEAAAKQFTKNGKAPAKYRDFRKLLERGEVQVVLDCTPDHWHTLVNLAATKAGKDVYGEKPLTLAIDEGRHLIQAVREHKTVFQTGTQQRSDPRFRLACELIRNGRIGKLKEVTVWLPAGLREGPFKAKPVPSELNWDFWLGQAPKVDYLPQRCHLYFRYWYDYSGGTMTDWGAHHNDIALWAIGLPGPVAIEGKPLAQPIPGGYTAFSEYEVQFTYGNGVIHHVRTTTADNIFGGVENPNGQRNGIRFEGTEGWIWVNRGTLRANDEALIKKPLPDTAQRLYASDDHMGNFFDCIRSRKPPIAEVEVGHRSACICHLGAIALRTGRKLQWDPAKQAFHGDHAEEANAYVVREMRAPYDYNFVG